MYFVAHKEEAEKLGIDLTKGILLTDPIGCGKTSLLTLMRFVPQVERNHIIKSCRDVSLEFIQEGYEVISRYSRLAFNNHQPKIYCFDDLGAEQNLKYYGNECNVIAEVLLSRYEYFISHDMITHVTTNLSASEIEMLYGNRFALGYEKCSTCLVLILIPLTNVNSNTTNLILINRTKEESSISVSQ